MDEERQRERERVRCLCGGNHQRLTSAAVWPTPEKILEKRYSREREREDKKDNREQKDTRKEKRKEPQRHKQEKKKSGRDKKNSVKKLGNISDDRESTGSDRKGGGGRSSIDFHLFYRVLPSFFLIGLCPLRCTETGCGGAVPSFTEFYRVFLVASFSPLVSTSGSYVSAGCSGFFFALFFLFSCRKFSHWWVMTSFCVGGRKEKERQRRR